MIGGLILSLSRGPDNWRWVFYVNVPIGLVALVLATRFVPSRTSDGWHCRDLDLLGFCYSAVACSACASRC